MVINIVLGRQSEQAIAAIAVFRTLEGLVIGFFAGFSNAASVLVGKSVGAGELDTAYERAKRLVLLCGCSIFVLCATLLAVHRPLLSVMSLSGESLEIGTGLLMIYSVAAVIRMCNWTQNDTYRSAGDAAYETTLPSTTRAGVVITPYAAICAKSVTWSMVVSIFNSASAARVASSNALHFAQPDPRTLTPSDAFSASA